MIRRIAGLREIAGAFDVFFLDQFGVLHDGAEPYPGVIDALRESKAAGKTLVVISNSGKRARPNIERLTRLGFADGTFDALISSGEVAHGMIAAGKLALSAGSRPTCLLLTRDNDRSAVDGLDIELVDDAAEADMIFLGGSEGDRYDEQHYVDLLRDAAHRGTPCLCTNPDKIMLTSSGRRFGAGRIAELYEAMGAPVIWVGKPYPEIYDFALETIGSPARDRVLCIGDSVEHDIAGAKAAGLTSLLIESGVLDGAPAEELQNLFRRHAATPEFQASSLRW